MKRAKIAELRDHLSRYLDHVRAGGHVIIFERNEPIAEIVPIGASLTGERSSDDARLAALEREGVIRKGRGQIPAELLRGPLPGAGAGVLDALLEERREGR